MIKRWLKERGQQDYVCSGDNFRITVSIMVNNVPPSEDLELLKTLCAWYQDALSNTRLLIDRINTLGYTPKKEL